MRPSALRVRPVDAVARDQAVAVDAHEVVVEFGFQRLERFLDQDLALGVVHDDVLVFGQQVEHVADRHELQVAAHARAQVAAPARAAAGIFGALASAAPLKRRARVIAAAGGRGGSA